MRAAKYFPGALLVFCTLLLLLPGTARADEYTLDDGNTLTYTATETSVTITKYNGSGTSVTIPNTINGVPVTSIETNAFYGCTTLTSVTLPDNLTTIGMQAFWSCTGLTSLSIPDSVTSIGTGAFGRCTSLGHVNIPARVTSLGGTTSPFSGCTQLKTAGPSGGNYNIELSWTTGSIPANAFNGCANLESVVIPNGMTSIGENAFMGCTRLNNVNLPNGLTEIGWQSFMRCTSLTSVSIPNDVTSIGTGAFSNCTSLEHVNIPAGVTSLGGTTSPFSGCTQLKTAGPSVGNYNIELSWTTGSIPANAFYDCANLESVVIPNGMTGIEYQAFRGCTNLASVDLPNSLTTIGENAFMSCARLNNVNLPNGLTEIGWQSFMNCTSLTSVTIPASVTRVRTGAFSNCTSLEKVRILSSPEFESTSGSSTAAFPGCTKLTSAGPLDGGYSIEFSWTTGSIPANAFKDCANLTSVTIPEGITAIGASAFRKCTSLTNVTIPSGVTTIGQDAFIGCTGLTDVTMPVSVTTIASGAFSNTGLTDVWYGGSESDRSLINIGGSNTPLENATWHYNTISTTYTITVSVSPLGSGTASGGGTFIENTSVTVTATPGDGYRFAGWTENGVTVSTDGSYTFTVTEDRSLTAVFEPVSSVVTSISTRIDSIRVETASGVRTAVVSYTVTRTWDDGVTEQFPVETRTPL